MVKVGIIGATGYVGAELVRLLHRRKDIRLTTVVSNSFQASPFLIYTLLLGAHLIRYATSLTWMLCAKRLISL